MTVFLRSLRRLLRRRHSENELLYGPLIFFGGQFDGTDAGPGSIPGATRFSE
jgi:hypothetical protein